MSQKTKTLLIVLFAIVSFVLVAIVFLFVPMKQKMTQEDAIVNLPKLTCDYTDDQDAYIDAITKKDVNLCSCVKDTNFQVTCKSATMDILFYTRAIDHLDESLCDKIMSTIQKEACVSVVKDSVVQLQEKDPLYLASIQANTHNEKAIDTYEKLIQTDNKNIDNYITLALAYAEKGLKEQEQGNDQTPYVEKSLQTIEKAKILDKNNAEIYRVEAYANEIKPDHFRAISLYDKAIEIDKNSARAYAGRGHVNRMMGALENAIGDFAKAAELDMEREHISIYTNLCSLEYSRGNNEDAIKNCKIVIQKKNADPVFQSEAYQIMTMIFIQNKDFTQANNYLLTAKTLTPADPNLYVTFSKLKIFEQNYTESEAHAKKAIELSPTKALSYLALSHTLYMQEKYSESIDAAQKGLTLADSDVSLLTPSKPPVKRDLHYSIANNYRQMGDSAKQAEYEKRAEDAFNQSLK